MIECQDCSGYGENPKDGGRCLECHGTGEIRECY